MMQQLHEHVEGERKHWLRMILGGNTTKFVGGFFEKKGVKI